MLYDKLEVVPPQRHIQMYCFFFPLKKKTKKHGFPILLTLSNLHLSIWINNFTQNDLQCIQAIHVIRTCILWELKQWPWLCSTSRVTAQLISYQQIYIKQMKWEWIYASWPLKLQVTFPTSITSVLIYAWLQINLLS